jgi:hypothetical protein
MAPRERETMRGDLPSLRAHLRVAGRGRGWGVYQLAPLAASLLRHPHPRPLPTASRGEGSRGNAIVAQSESNVVAALRVCYFAAFSSFSSRRASTGQ